MKELYDNILYDDGRAPQKFTKDHLEVTREEVNDKIKGDIRISSRNLRAMKASGAKIDRGDRKEMLVKSY
jgi:hypothetical protein